MKQLGLVFGGTSKEHDVSLVSAKYILQSLNRSRWSPVLLGISRSGDWYRLREEDLLQTAFDRPIDIPSCGELIFEKGPQKALGSWKQQLQLDVVFPIVHGTTGEDGVLQGFFETLGVPYVGCKVSASALCMDKEFAKIILAHHQVPIVPFLVVRSPANAPAYEEVVEQLGTPLFVKPCSSGSSVGVTRVTRSEEWGSALKEAFLHDHKVLVESAISGDEVEVAVKGSRGHVEVSLPGTFKVPSEFYSYDAKYLSEGNTTFQIPAFQDETKLREIRQLSQKAFTAVGGEGLARIDFFHSPEGKLYLNEINTLPGFTPISMYPMLWEHSGLPYSDLIDSLLDLAMA